MNHRAQHHGGFGPNGTQEKRTSVGNIIALACGKLKRPRYINPKIEAELVDFKKEIEEKFAKSKLRSFKFPLKKMAPKLPDTMRTSRYNSNDFGGDKDIMAPSINGRR